MSSWLVVVVRRAGELCMSVVYRSDLAPEDSYAEVTRAEVEIARARKKA